MADDKEIEVDADESRSKCSPGEHLYESREIAVAKFVRGDATCERATRFLLFCVYCSDAKFVEDPEGLVIR